MSSSKATVGLASTVPLKSNRLGSLLDQLEKAWPFSRDGQPDEKEMDHIRYVTGKLQQLLSSQEKCRKELMGKSCSGIRCLLTILEAISNWDLQITLNIVSCFNELLTSGKRIGALTDHELPDILLKTLAKIAPRDPTKDPAVVEEVIVLFHAVFSKMGTKDKRFAVQARMTGALQVSLNVAKQNPQNFKVLHPVLQVLKIYANSPVNCSIMIKGGAIETLLKVLPFCGQKRILSAKVVLDILTLLVKSKIGARRAVIQGSVPLLMNMFVDWHRTDHRHRQIPVRKAILTVLKNIVMINGGRKAMTQIDGMKILYNIGLEGLECKELDSMTKLIILILRRCFARSSLPLRASNSMFRFCVKSPVDTESSTDNSEDELNCVDTCDDDMPVAEKTDMDDNDDINDDEDDEKVVGERDAENDSIEHEAKPRTRQDLEIYNVFVNELLEYTVDSESKQFQVVDEIDRGSTIVIPTATTDRLSKEGSDSIFPSTYSIKRECHKFKKASSLDSSFILTERKSSPPNILPQCNANVEAEFTTESAIQHIGSSSCNSPSLTHPRQKTPSMPLIPLQRTMNSSSLDTVDLLVKGMHLRKDCSSSPSLRELVDSNCSPTHYHSQGQDRRDRSCTLNLPRPRSASNALLALDSQHRRTTEDDDDIGLKHILPFVKKAAPAIYGHHPLFEPEPLLEKKPGIHRAMIFQDFYRFICPDKIINRVVYDLDELISIGKSYAAFNERITSSYTLTSKKASTSCSSKPLNVGQSFNEESSKLPILSFESRFESGNLRKAIQIRQYEYDLLLNCDINSDHHCQWFYFEVSNMEQSVPYRFNIINCEKFNSQFNFGMQPVLYSTKDAETGLPGWERAGSNICYYKNFYLRKADGIGANRYYYTATFTISFPYSNDVCYVAYHYPYTVSMMKAHLCKLEGMLASNIYYDNQILCFTSLGNECDIITVTEKPNKDDRQSLIAFRKRPYIVLTSRVHPGESCASWVVKGALDFLMSNNELAIQLRETFIFKIVPCLNPDGVINGNHRCSVSGDDLNRQWISPDPNNHPTIYHTKGFIEYLNSINKSPLIYCDFHGHSRKKNVFMYGCSVNATHAARQQGNLDTVFFNMVNGAEGEPRIEMTTVDDVNSSTDEDSGYKTLPRILNAIAPAFSIQSCNYVMEKSKESTARVVVFKELGILRSYTLESTYCGADQGPYKGDHFGTRELEEMGKNFCIGLLKLSHSYSVKLKQEYFCEPNFYTCEEDDSTDQRESTFDESKGCKQD